MSKENTIQVYPNPTSEKLFINSSNNASDILIKNILGEKILNKEFSDAIDIKDLPKGIYIIEIYNMGVLLFQEKIIVNK